MKIKILQIGTASSSLSVQEYKKDIYRAWNAQVGTQMKRLFPELEIECWGIERKFKREYRTFAENIKFRIFPTTVSIRHGMEISLKMLYALQKELEEAKKAKRKIILHFHEYHTWQIYLLLAFVNKRLAKIIGQHHGGRSPLENLRKYKKLAVGFPVFAIMQSLENRFFKRIDKFYALSDNEITYLKKVSPDSYIKFQTMGISDEYFKKTKKAVARKKLGLEKTKKYALYIGRLKSTKGTKELLDAAKVAKDVAFLIIGGGSGYDFYKSYAQRNEINNVCFLGEIYDKKKLDYLSACDCLILPSYTEGAPVVIMEALARNLPVIATNVGGIPKMISKKNGIITKPKSKIDIILALNRIFMITSKGIKKTAERYKWNRIIKETYLDYKRLI